MAQTLSLARDRQATAAIVQTFDYLYAYRTVQADSTLRTLAPKWSNYPGYLLVDALIDYWRYMPISLYGQEYNRYKATVGKAAQLAEKMLERNPTDYEATFFCMMAYTILARQASEDGDNLKAVGYAKDAFKHLKSGFDLQARNPDFYFSTGLYKYYRIRYPEDHQIYKPFLSFFPGGDKAEGLHNLELAAEKGLYTKTEATMFLAFINLRYEHKPERGLAYANQLVRRYPSNPAFRVLLSEALLLNNKLEDVPTHAGYAVRFPSPLVKAGAEAMLGWYHERQGDRAKAAALYQDALKRVEHVSKQADNVKSICLAGQARLAAYQGKRHIAKQLYRDVLDFTNHAVLRDEARRYLRRLDDEGNRVKRKEYLKNQANASTP